MKTRIRSTMSAPQTLRNSTPRGDDAWPMIRDTRIALQRLLDGVGNHDDLLQVGMAINLTWQRCHAIGESDEAMRQLETAGAVVQEMEYVGRYHLDGERARHDVIDAINLYDETMRASSPLQMEAAAKALAKQFMQGTR